MTLTSSSTHMPPVNPDLHHLCPHAPNLGLHPLYLCQRPLRLTPVLILFPILFSLLPLLRLCGLLLCHDCIGRGVTSSSSSTSTLISFNRSIIPTTTFTNARCPTLVTLGSPCKVQVAASHVIANPITLATSSSLEDTPNSGVMFSYGSNTPCHQLWCMLIL